MDDLEQRVLSSSWLRRAIAEYQMRRYVLGWIDPGEFEMTAGELAEYQTWIGQPLMTIASMRIVLRKSPKGR